ncbi:1-phosphatidylinositol phosphodiesterase-like [Astyanax mexicanus]|uniref:1-phosphatidylinositol phosphodiesterase-like n=1 Tax=Astyanax mexicanus TaxID=7994 RepID=UPI0020CAF518|nr:1-phosphatidylinositol phosphodiesterase-like [Astyanax mexicanus]
MKNFNQVLGVSLLIVLLGKSLGQSQNQAFNDAEKLQLPQSYQINWMSNLNDNFYLSQLTLPGTHDTMARYGGPAVDCQVWTLEDQLKAGIRYLDLRAFAFGDSLRLMHGIVYEFSTFKEALATIKKFLSQYPTETVLVRVKPELLNKENVQGLVEQAIYNDQNVWVSSTVPTLGQVRGKVVFVQKDSFRLGLPLVETDTKGDYEVTHIKHKEQEVSSHLNQALTKCGGSSIILTYSSGTGIGTFEGMFLTPKRVAEKIDPWLYSYLEVYLNNVPDICFGIIAMDFPGLELIQAVINFNLQL